MNDEPMALNGASRAGADDETKKRKGRHELEEALDVVVDRLRFALEHRYAHNVVTISARTAELALELLERLNMAALDQHDEPESSKGAFLDVEKSREQ